MGFICKAVSPLTKVFASARDVPELDRRDLAGLRGETVSFQIAYFWDGERKSSGFCRTQSPLKERIRLREVRLVPCEYPCHRRHDDGYLVTQPGVYPDLLTELTPFGFPLVPGQWRSLWVDIPLGKDLAAGSYPVRIALSTKDGPLGEVSVAVEVIDAELPRLPIAHTEWLHCDCLATYYRVEIFSEAHWKILENFIRTAVEHKCNMLLTPVFTPPLDTAVGGERPTVQLVEVTVTPEGYRFDFSKFRRWVKMAQGCGMEYFEISHLFSQWGAAATPKIMALRDGVYQKIFGWETRATDPAYAAFLHRFLTALKGELEALGIAGRTYFHISDEPFTEHVDSYRAALNIVAKDLEGYPIMDALSNYAFYREGLTKMPVCAMDHIKPFLEDGQRPEKLWGYYCTAQCMDVTNRYIALPGFRTRILGAQIYKYRLAGFLHWGYNFYNCEHSLRPIDPYRCTDGGGTFPSGDPFLVYPGPGGEPEGSIRLMLMDEAMSDVCAMHLLETLTDRETVMACMEADGTVGIDAYPQSDVWLMNMRRRINEKIAQAAAST